MSIVQQPDTHPMEVVENDIRSFQESIRDHSNYDFTEYSLTSLRRRLTKILLEYDMGMDELTGRLGSDPEFLEKTVKKLTVHTTELFRDPNIWITIRKELLPSMREKPSLHIWHPGCSTGQEIFSMMMVLEDLGMLDKTYIYGSDINPDVIETARQGRYKYHFNQSYLENFDRVLLNGAGEDATRDHKKPWRKYFTIDESRDMIQMNANLCSKPVYKKLDLVKDPNLFLVKFDLIVCRNVIIYFNNELQNRVFDLFYQNLNNGGTLLLGVHESIMGPFSKRFLKKDPFYHKQLA
jgi:chemotaxis protein methyltransferase CheR